MPKMKPDAPEGATKTRAPRKPALPAELVQKIEEYAAAESKGFKRVNRGALIKAVQAYRQGMIDGEIIKVDNSLRQTPIETLLKSLA